MGDESMGHEEREVYGGEGGLSGEAAGPGADSPGGTGAGSGSSGARGIGVAGQSGGTADGADGLEEAGSRGARGAGARELPGGVGQGAGDKDTSRSGAAFGTGVPKASGGAGVRGNSRGGWWGAGFRGTGGGTGLIGAGEARGEVSRLPEELRALGRSLGSPGKAGSETMVERVLGQILAEQLPVPVAEPPRTRASGADLSGIGERWRTVRRWARVRRRTLVAALCGLLTVLVLTPPVRAAVFDWFGFGGVEVRYDPSAAPSPGAEAPGCGRSVSLAQAEERAGFAPLVPDALGAPDTVEVTREPEGRFLMSLCWHENGRTIRLDEYPARLDIGFTKTVREQPAWLSLSGDVSSDGNPRDLALWFPRPHLLSLWLVDETGEHFTRSRRTAGPTLLWTHEGAAGDTGDAGGPGDARDVTVTLRLEGVASQARALEIAKSAD